MLSGKSMFAPKIKPSQQQVEPTLKGDMFKQIGDAETLGSHTIQTKTTKDSRQFIVNIRTITYDKDIEKYFHKGFEVKLFLPKSGSPLDIAFNAKDENNLEIKMNDSNANSRSVVNVARDDHHLTITLSFTGNEPDVNLFQSVLVASAKAAYGLTSTERDDVRKHLNRYVGDVKSGIIKPIDEQNHTTETPRPGK